MDRGLKTILFPVGLIAMSLLLLPEAAHANMGPMSTSFYRGILVNIVLVLALILAITWFVKEEKPVMFLGIVLLLAIYTGYVHRRPPFHYMAAITWGSGRANLEAVRSSLVSYSADSFNGKYPIGEYGFEQFREAMPTLGLNYREEDVRWEGNSFSYISTNGGTFVLKVNNVPWLATGTILATPDETLPEDYYDHMYLFQEGASDYWGVDENRIDLLRRKFIDMGHGERLK